MNRENTYKTICSRAFLTNGLPEPLTPADRHLQLFDNYLAGTRIRLRRIREPETKIWTRSLEQIIPAIEGKFSQMKISNIFLNEAEYQAFKPFEGREIRKNRYFYESEGKMFEIDIFLGKLWGLNIARIYFETAEESAEFELPCFSVLGITDDAFFTGFELVEKEFSDVQDRLAD